MYGRADTVVAVTDEVLAQLTENMQELWSTEPFCPSLSTEEINSPSLVSKYGNAKSPPDDKNIIYTKRIA